MSEIINLGLDDIDSPRGGCTTHFARLVVERLEREGVRWIDYPNLIRLNPNIPYRTRGNGAVALRFQSSVLRPQDVLVIAREILEEYVVEDYPNTNPGIVCVRESTPPEIVTLADLALWRAIPLRLVNRLVTSLEIVHHTQGNGRGLIGALAAIGNKLENDHTYEYIAYRSSSESHSRRGVDPLSVREMDKRFREQLFSNIDDVDGRVLIEPHGPDPVLYGVRGESPEAVIEASKYIHSEQNVKQWMVFRTNQGTGEHLQHRMTIRLLRPYMSAVIEGTVHKRPRIIEGGHVIFSIRDETGEVECAVYEPTGILRETANSLLPEDRVSVCAGVRPASRLHALTLNVEGLKIIELTQNIKTMNPVCPECKKRMKSAGRDKGFKCVKCGYRWREGEKVITTRERAISTGMYLPPLSAQRHLTRPYVRESRKNKGLPEKLLSEWYS